MEENLNENNVKSDNINKVIKITTWVSIVISIIFIILIPILLTTDYAAYDISVPFGDGLQFFFQTNGFIGLFFLIWLVVTIVLKRGGAIGAKIALWGLLIFSILSASSFVANLYYLPQVTSDAVLAFFATYIPVLCAIINLIAVLSNWNTHEKTTVNRVIMVSALISVFWTVYYCMQVGADSSPVSDAQYINMWMVITGALTIVLISIMLYLTTTSRSAFVQSFFGTSATEAAIVELVDDIAEENAQLINDGIDVLEKAAQKMDENNNKDLNN